jgi:transcriptional regulator with XRE-family HTH domain
MAQLPIHEAIRAACAGLDQRALAAGVGVDQSTISRWIRGETQPSFEKLMRLEVAAGRARGYVLRLAGMIDVEVNARHALDQDEALSDEARAILVAAYEVAVAVRSQMDHIHRSDSGPDNLVIVERSRNVPLPPDQH